MSPSSPRSHAPTEPEGGHRLRFPVLSLVLGIAIFIPDFNTLSLFKADAQADVATAFATLVEGRSGTELRVGGHPVALPDVSPGGATLSLVPLDTDHVALRADTTGESSFYLVPRRSGRSLRASVRVRATPSVELVPRLERGTLVVDARVATTCGPVTRVVRTGDLVTAAPSVTAPATEPARPDDARARLPATLARIEAGSETWLVVRSPALPLATTALHVRDAHGRGPRGVTLALQVGEGAESPLVLDETGRAALAAPFRCAVVVARGVGAAAIADVRAELGLAESEVDASLVAELASEGARAEQATASLVSRGASALPALEASFAEATSSERRRILRVAERMASTVPNALRLFVMAIESDDAELADHAIERLVAMGALGQRGLVAALERGNVRVAVPFAERAPERAMPALLGLLEDADATRRAEVRPALVTASRRSGSARTTALSFVAGDAAAENRALVLACLAEASPSEQLNAAQSFLSSERSVETELQLLTVLTRLPEAPAGPLADFVRGCLASDAWMVREAALPLASRLGDLAAVRAALEDPYPRVRARAVSLLTEDTASLRRIVELARTDPWPIVRLSGLVVVASHGDAHDLVARALGDRSTRVRIGLYARLATLGDASFVEQAVATLGRERTPAAVGVAAIEYLADVCGRDALGALRELVEAGLGAPSERTQRLAVAAATALLRMGGEEDVALAERLLGPRPARAGAARCPGS